MNAHEMNAYIAHRFGVDLSLRSPIDLPIGRNGLAALFRDLDFKTGVEMGVDQGEFTEVLCRANPQAMIFGVDAWKAYKGYREHLDQNKMDILCSVARARLAPYNNCELIRKFSLDAVQAFVRDALDFVYIDGNHEFRQVVDDIDEWSKRVRVGGIVSGHDYRKLKGNGPFHVAWAVSGYVGAHGINPWFVLRSDHSPSWMWVKA